MRLIKWIGFIAAVSLIVSCFFPWAHISSGNLIISGVDAKGTNFGKPGYFHFLMILFFLVFNFTPKVWAKRSNLLITSLNLAWAVRNYFVISSCHMGDCPEKKLAIYLLIPTSFIMLISALFPDVNLNKKREEK